jgi:hypothetical protein
MSFAKPDIPPHLERLLEEIEKRGGTVTHQEFKELCFRFRFTNKDFKYYTRWLRDHQYIEINKGKITKLD